MRATQEHLPRYNKFFNRLLLTGMGLATAFGIHSDSHISSVDISEALNKTSGATTWRMPINDERFIRHNGDSDVVSIAASLPRRAEHPVIGRARRPITTTTTREATPGYVPLPDVNRTLNPWVLLGMALPLPALGAIGGFRLHGLGGAIGGGLSGIGADVMILGNTGCSPQTAETSPASAPVVIINQPTEQALNTDAPPIIQSDLIVVVSSETPISPTGNRYPESIYSLPFIDPMVIRSTDELALNWDGARTRFDYLVTAMRDAGWIQGADELELYSNFFNPNQAQYQLLGIPGTTDIVIRDTYTNEYLVPMVNNLLAPDLQVPQAYINAVNNTGDKGDSLVRVKGDRLSLVNGWPIIVSNQNGVEQWKYANVIGPKPIDMNVNIDITQDYQNWNVSSLSANEQTIFWKCAADYASCTPQEKALYDSFLIDQYVATMKASGVAGLENFQGSQFVENPSKELAHLFMDKLHEYVLMTGRSNFDLFPLSILREVIKDGSNVFPKTNNGYGYGPGWSMADIQTFENNITQINYYGEAIQRSENANLVTVSETLSGDMFATFRVQGDNKDVSVGSLLYLQDENKQSHFALGRLNYQPSQTTMDDTVVYTPPEGGLYRVEVNKPGLELPKTNISYNNPQHVNEDLSKETLQNMLNKTGNSLHVMLHCMKSADIGTIDLVLHNGVPMIYWIEVTTPIID
jgi:hypothetical protein